MDIWRRQQVTGSREKGMGIEKKVEVGCTAFFVAFSTSLFPRVPRTLAKPERKVTRLESSPNFPSTVGGFPQSPGVGGRTALVGQGEPEIHVMEGLCCCVCCFVREQTKKRTPASIIKTRYIHTHAIFVSCVSSETATTCVRARLVPRCLHAVACLHPPSPAC